MDIIRMTDKSGQSVTFSFSLFEAVITAKRLINKRVFAIDTPRVREFEDALAELRGYYTLGYRPVAGTCWQLR